MLHLSARQRSHTAHRHRHYEAPENSCVHVLHLSTPGRKARLPHARAEPLVATTAVVQLGHGRATTRLWSDQSIPGLPTTIHTIRALRELTCDSSMCT